MSEDLKSKSENATSSTEPTELEKLQAEVAKWKNEYLYLRADFDNYKKSVIKERAELMKYGSERIFVEILEVMDNFERALAFDLTSDKLESFSKGVRLIADEMRTLLTRFGIQEVPALGVKFDPNVHNALGSEPTEKVAPGHISQVFKKAYKLHDKLIRPAQVIVASEAPEKGPES